MPEKSAQADAGPAKGPSTLTSRHRAASIEVKKVV